MKGNVLILGSGGREFTLAWSALRSHTTEKVFVAPGNAGTALFPKCSNIAIDPMDFAQVRDAILEHDIDKVVVGPDGLLAAGIIDYLEKDDNVFDVTTMGPRKEAARLEFSKDFAKKFMTDAEIPTAKYRSFTAEQLAEAVAYLDTIQAPYVLKADGLAAGKGVIITSDLAEAKAEVEAMLKGKFGDASKTLVIEEFLKGIEFSIILIVNGAYQYLLLPTSKDYKTIGEGDVGLNTGGMGAVSPVPFADEAFMQKVEKRVIIPMMENLEAADIEYNGFMYLGMINVDGEPYVLEINARSGDPETEVIFPRIQTDFLELVNASNTLMDDGMAISVDPRACVTIILTAAGYPGKYETGKVITGLRKNYGDDVIIMHCGTKLLPDDTIVTNGGRVLAVTALGETIAEARERCLEVAEQIQFEGKYYRKDIGHEFITETSNTDMIGKHYRNYSYSIPAQEAVSRSW